MMTLWLCQDDPVKKTVSPKHDDRALTRCFVFSVRGKIGKWLTRCYRVETHIFCLNVRTCCACRAFPVFPWRVTYNENDIININKQLLVLQLVFVISGVMKIKVTIKWYHLPRTVYSGYHKNQTYHCFLIHWFNETNDNTNTCAIHTFFPKIFIEEFLHNFCPSLSVFKVRSFSVKDTNWSLSHVFTLQCARYCSWKSSITCTT